MAAHDRSLPLLVRIPHLSRADAEIALRVVIHSHEVRQAEPADLADLIKRDLDLTRAGMRQPRREAGQDALFAVLAGADDEWEAETLAVGSVQSRELGDLGGRETVQPGCCLLGNGGGAEGAGQRRPADEI